MDSQRFAEICMEDKEIFLLAKQVQDAWALATIVAGHKQYAIPGGWEPYADDASTITKMLQDKVGGQDGEEIAKACKNYGIRMATEDADRIAAQYGLTQKSTQRD